MDSPGSWEIATSGGRSQLGLLLKGSKDKRLLKHNLQASPAFGQLSFLTLEEIENRIDHVIRKGDLRVEFFWGPSSDRAYRSGLGTRSSLGKRA